MTTKPFAAQERYRERQKNAGMVRINPLVPEEDRQRALDYCAKLRRDRKKKEGV